MTRDLKPYCSICHSPLQYHEEKDGNKTPLDYCIECDSTIHIVFWKQYYRGKIRLTEKTPKL